MILVSQALDVFVKDLYFDLNQILNSGFSVNDIFRSVRLNVNLLFLTVAYLFLRDLFGSL
uniref:Uncharacterized protein n=1 Tax=Rhizophora mucronata TaxID=61149 RepID=A0A2P2JWE3_RHIMU